MNRIFFAIILTLIISSLAYSIPDVENDGYFGRITYSRYKQRLRFNIHRYNNEKQKSREEIYDSEGYLVKYKTFEYDPQNLLKMETEYNNEQKLTKKITYNYNKNGREYLRTISRPEKPDLYVESQYIYHRNRILYHLQKYFYDKDNFNRKTLIKKTVYTYNNNSEKLVEHYRKESSEHSGKFIFKSAQIYKYNGQGRISGILVLNSNRYPVNYMEYIYNENNKIAKINIFKTKLKYRRWNRSYPKLSQLKFSIKHSIFYSYEINDKRFSGVKQLKLKYEEIIKDDKKDDSKQDTIIKKDNDNTTIIIKPDSDINTDKKNDKKDEKKDEKSVDSTKTIDNPLDKNKKDDKKTDVDNKVDVKKDDTEKNNDDKDDPDKTDDDKIDNSTKEDTDDNKDDSDEDEDEDEDDNKIDSSDDDNSSKKDLDKKDESKDEDDNEDDTDNTTKESDKNNISDNKDDE